MTGVTEKLFRCQMFMCLFRPLELKLSRSYRAISAGPAPPTPTPSEHLPPDLIWSGNHLFGSESGQKRVQIRSGGRCSEGVGVGGAGPAEIAL